MNTHNGWLVGQLPQAMARDRVIEGFVHACQEVADGLRHRVESVEHELDVDLAAPEMLTFVASWLGVPAEVEREFNALVASEAARTTGDSRQGGTPSHQ